MESPTNNNAGCNGDQNLNLTKIKLKAKYKALVKANLELEEKAKIFEEKNKLLVMKNQLLASQLEEKSKYYNKLADHLEEQVKCPVCLEVPTSGPMYSCPRGHLICSSCYQGTLSDCPMCRTRMSNTVSLLASAVVQNIEHRCRFETEGCKVRCLVGEVEEHKQVCDFRPVSCPSFTCKSKVPLVNVVDHILNQCKYSIAKAKGGSFNSVDESSASRIYVFPAKDIVSSSFKVSTFNWKDKFFFLNQVPEDGLHRRFYVQMLGSEEECESYTVAITLGDKTEQHFVSCSSNPLPIEMSEDDSKAGGMKVRIKTLKKICAPAPAPGCLEYLLTLTFSEV